MWLCDSTIHCKTFITSCKEAVRLGLASIHATAVRGLFHHNVLALHPIRVHQLASWLPQRAVGMYCNTKKWLQFLPPMDVCVFSSTKRQSNLTLGRMTKKVIYRELRPFYTISKISGLRRQNSRPFPDLWSVTKTFDLEIWDSPCTDSWHQLHFLLFMLFLAASFSLIIIFVYYSCSQNATTVTSKRKSQIRATMQPQHNIFFQQLNNISTTSEQ